MMSSSSDSDSGSSCNPNMVDTYLLLYDISSIKSKWSDHKLQGVAALVDLKLDFLKIVAIGPVNCGKSSVLER